MANFQLLIFGFFVHIILLFAVFDIYFKSTVITGISPINNTIPPLGRRVVVISADGLRADSLFDKETGELADLMPYMRSVMQEKATWGLSQSHVPTESRPGHVAMLAGFYEDPSAVTKGWKENPVTFDSVFNRSFCSFSWGSPDVLNIFLKGLNRDCAHGYSYKNEQNFAGDTMEYDNWVHREFISFLVNSRDKHVLFDNGVLFFLHLLGQDTSGHTHKPYSARYIQNLKNVDRIVREIEIVLNEFYKDDLTSFVFTSDHGMTDWGSHGSGDPNETDTPIVAWGAGINMPMTEYKMFNINQADITPLLSILLGSPIPVNSVGLLPLDYLNMTDQYRSEAILLNAKQITSQFKTNLENVKSQVIPFFHSPFEKLTDYELDLMIRSISDQIRNKQYGDAIQKSKVLIQIALEGLEYYQNYYQRPLLISISSSFVLWIILLTIELYDSTKPGHNVLGTANDWISQIVFSVFASITIVLVVIQNLPSSYSFYFVLPQFLLYVCCGKAKKSHYLMLRHNFLAVVLSALLIGIGTEVIVSSFFHRYLLSLSLIFTFIWSFIAIGSRKTDRIIVSVWFISGVILSAFCALPSVGGQPNVIVLVMSGFILFLFLLLMFMLNMVSESMLLFSIRCLTVAGAAWNSAVVHGNFREGGLHQLNQFLSWALCVFALVLLMLGKRSILERFDKVFTSLLIPFLLLSICHEGLFMMFLFIHLRSWIYFEYENFSANRFDKDRFKMDFPGFSDFRRAYMFLLYIWVGFFGLGNIASLNSFDPAWVRCFVTVFSPFTMSSLILLKTIIPFLIVACSIRVLTVILKLRPDQLFIIVLIYCNLMGLNFLHLIKNKGSWLEIGSSISHYVIQQVAVVFLLSLYGLAKFLLSFSFNVFPEQRRTQPGADPFDSKEPLMLLPRYHSNYKFHRS